MKNSVEVSQTIKNRTTIYDPATSFLSVYPKELKIGSQWDYLYTDVHCRIIRNSQDVEAT